MSVSNRLNDVFGSAVILGASGDIGGAFKTVIERDFDRLILTGTKPLQNFSDQGIKEDWVEYSYPNKIDELTMRLCQEAKSIRLVINCIGLHVREKSVLDVELTRKILDANYFSLQFVLSEVKKYCGKGVDIINIGSIASHSPAADEFSYSSSKELSDRLLANLRFDEQFKNSRILNVRPAAVKGKMTGDRPNANNFIEPLELAQLSYNILKSGSTLRVPLLDVYRAN